MLGWVDEDDALYMTKLLDRPCSGLSVEQIQGALAQVGNAVIFPPLPIPWWFAHTGVTVSDSWDAEPDPDVYHLKRPWVAAFGIANDMASDTDDDPVAHWFAYEVRNLEKLARHPAHPHHVRYHGCRVRRGHITGVLLGRVPGGTTLDDYAIDRRSIVEAPSTAVMFWKVEVGIVQYIDQQSRDGPAMLKEPQPSKLCPGRTTNRLPRRDQPSLLLDGLERPTRSTHASSIAPGYNGKVDPSSTNTSSSSSSQHYGHLDHVWAADGNQL